MATNPKNPLDDRANDLARQQKKAQIPWGLIAAILFVVCLGLLVYYFSSR